jgi:DNA-binding response OmpR family regulator
MPIDPTARHALVVDDAAEFRALVGGLLRHEGFTVFEASNGVEGVEAARTHDPEIVVLDLSMPEIDGIEACRQIRTFSQAHIMMLTVRDEEVDVLIGLAVGADGYMTKPFSPREFSARINAMTRRPREAQEPAPLPGPVQIHVVAEPELDESEPAAGLRQFGELTVDPLGRSVWVDGHEVELTRTEFDLLDVLTSAPRVAFRREILLDRVWGGDYFGSAHVVDVHIANLRRKLGEDPRHPRFIRTYRGVGYRIIAA